MLKIFTIAIILVSTFVHAAEERPNESLQRNLQKLLGKWVSIEHAGWGKRVVSIVVSIKDDSIMTMNLHEVSRNGEKDIESNSGKFMYGLSQIEVRTEGSPKGVKVENPSSHHQSAKFSYKFDNEKLVLTLIKGGPDGATVTLKKFN